MIERIIIAGAGGQGIMLLGKVLAHAAMLENKQVTWMPAYGPEVRGGAAHCMVVISDEEISSPCVDEADTLIIMNDVSLKRFKVRIKNQGLLIVNQSLAPEKLKGKGVEVLQYPFTDIAVKLGNPKVANMVALGCYLAKKKNISVKSVFQTMEQMAPKGEEELVKINQKALLSGKELVG